MCHKKTIFNILNLSKGIVGDEGLFNYLTLVADMDNRFMVPGRGKTPMATLSFLDVGTMNPARRNMTKLSGVWRTRSGPPSWCAARR